MLLQMLQAASLRGVAKAISWGVFVMLGFALASVINNLVGLRHLGDATAHPGLISATVLPIVLTAPLFVYFTMRLRELTLANHRLRTVAATDALTMCLNRGAFTERADVWLNRNERRGTGDTGALLVIDADHFKTVNDRFGHHSGDEALKLIASIIRSAVRGTDLVGRLGGEEFGVFLPDVDETTVTTVAERVRRAIDRSIFMPNGTRWPLTVSVGAVSFTRPADFTELFRIADAQLYEAKEKGRNRVEMTTIEPGEHIPDRRRQLN